jgi:hypothetical protein
MNNNKKQIFTKRSRAMDRAINYKNKGQQPHNQRQCGIDHYYSGSLHTIIFNCLCYFIRKLRKSF